VQRRELQGYHRLDPIYPMRADKFTLQTIWKSKITIKERER
jgi:hypothetical protein